MFENFDELPTVNQQLTLQQEFEALVVARTPWLSNSVNGCFLYAKLPPVILAEDIRLFVQALCLAGHRAHSRRCSSAPSMSFDFKTRFKLSRK